jgi:hypothetical protein
MSERIERGDMFVVVRPSVCCGRRDAIGTIGTVVTTPARCTCLWCKTPLYGPTVKDERGYGYLVVRIQKLNPPSADSRVERGEEREVTA